MAIDVEEQGRERRECGFALLSKYRAPLMGLWILLIIFFHFTEDCKTGGVRFSGFIEVFYTYIRSSGVDIFLMLSGLGLYYSWTRNPDAHLFFRKRFVRLLVPYFIVAVPAWIAYYCLTESNGVVNLLQDLFFISFFTDGTRWLWYVLMAGVCYALFPALYRFISQTHDRGDEWVRVATLVFASTLLVMLLQLYKTEVYSNLSIALTRFPAFFVGVWLGKCACERRSVSVRSLALATIIVVLAMYSLDLVGMKILGVYLRAGMALCLSFAFALLLDVLSRSAVDALRGGGSSCRAF